MCVGGQEKNIIACGWLPHLGPASIASNSRPAPGLPVIDPKGSHVTREGWQMQDEGDLGEEQEARFRALADLAGNLSSLIQKLNFCPSPESEVGMEGSQSRQACEHPPTPTATRPVW